MLQRCPTSPKPNSHLRLVRTTRNVNRTPARGKDKDKKDRKHPVAKDQRTVRTEPAANDRTKTVIAENGASEVATTTNSTNVALAGTRGRARLPPR